jgi:hypothetical protein
MYRIVEKRCKIFSERQKKIYFIFKTIKSGLIELYITQKEFLNKSIE